MKNNHETISLYISKAIAECKEDYTLNDVKKYLKAALAAVQSVGKKRDKRESLSQKLAEEAKKKNEKWMQSLKDGLKNLTIETPNDQE